MKAYQPINFEGKFARLAEQWSPRVIAEMNDKPFAVVETKLLLVEPRGTPNTGSEGGERTAPVDVWL